MSQSNNIEIKNKKAFFEYEILDKYVAGIVLKGTEIKSVREGKASIKEGYCFVNDDGEVWIKNMHIAEYKFGNVHNHEPKRDRKLLLGRQEIKKIEKQLKDVGLTLIPLKLFVGKRGYAKLQIGIAKGKKMHDKRQSIKEKDVERQLRKKFK